MSLYSFKCCECEYEFESIEKMGTQLTYCKKCGKIASRFKVDLPSPAKLVAGCLNGGFHKPSYGTRKYE